MIAVNVSIVVNVYGLQLQEDRNRRSFEAGETEARDLGSRPSSEMNSRQDLGQLTCLLG